MKKYAIVIPVYNRPLEVDELLESLIRQECKDFEVVIVEDGSDDPCKHVIDRYTDKIDIRYYYKENTGPGDSRNFGMEKAEAEYIILFDSDCIIPPQYFCAVDRALSENPLDAFGGPDAAHDSFSDIQKAINHAMTSFITTGGIRGRKKQLDKYQPRSFNMGFKKSAIKKIGGFSTVHPGEDPDLSYRIMNAGYNVGLIPEAYVFHKRRIDFSKFATQVYKFGMVRNILIKWHPGTFKWVYALPSIFLVGSFILFLLGLYISSIFLLPLFALAAIIFLEALVTTRNLKIAFLAVGASFIQLYGYGWGFLKGWWSIGLLKRDEREAFPQLFFD